MLSIVIKHFLTNRNLNNSVSGGLNEFSQSILIAAFISKHALVAAHIPNLIHFVGSFLLEFFQYFGDTFENSKFGVGPRGSDLKGYFFRKQSLAPNQIEIADPKNQLNIISRRATQYPAVKDEFLNAFRILANLRQDEYFLASDKSFLTSILNISFTIIKSRDSKDKKFRFFQSMIELYGNMSDELSSAEKSCETDAESEYW